MVSWGLRVLEDRSPGCCEVLLQPLSCLFSSECDFSSGDFTSLNVGFDRMMVGLNGKIILNCTDIDDFPWPG